MNKAFLAFFFLLFLPVTLFSQNVGIGTTLPQSSAKLEVSSNNSGFLPPRMTLAERDAIPSPVPGLMVFNTTTQSLDIFTAYGWQVIKSTLPSINKLLGGISDEVVTSARPTPDRGYIIAGRSSSSATGDVTGNNHGGSDCWIVKISSAGTIDWNKLLGGNGIELAPYIQRTTDGGYIFLAHTTSSANGDVSGTNHNNDGTEDLWVVKLDGAGNIVWNRLLGGNSNETGSGIQETSDGGYIIGSISRSSTNGDVTGSNHGVFDAWIVKLDGSGNIVWNKLLGGNQSEWITAIQQTGDGGFIFAGYTTTSVNGDVTGTNHGGRDGWVVKLDGSGNIVWNKLIGGNLDEEIRSIQQTGDGGYILTGYAFSSANGDVTGTNQGVNDCWVVKLDASGNIVWNKLIGGSQNELGNSIQQTTDGGYVIAVASFSSANGNVSGLNHGNFDYWVVKLDGSGNIIWNRLLGGNNADSPYFILQNVDGYYIIGGNTTSSANGDVIGNSHGASDIWIITLTGAGNLNE